jgi:hypothetical protein
MEQDMVESLSALRGGFDEDANLLVHPRLADELLEALGTQGGVACLFLFENTGGDRTLVGHRVVPALSS